MDNVSLILATIPFVAAHPFILILVVPALFWLLAHGMTLVKAPDEKSNAVWKVVYPFLNTFIAANYGANKNAPIAKELDEVLTTITTPTTVKG